MKFKRDVLIAYANNGRSKRVDGVLIAFVPFMMIFSGLVYYLSSKSVIKAVSVTVVFLLLCFAETLIFMGKYSLTNGYNFLYTAISFGLLSINLLIVSNSCILAATGEYLYVLSAVLIYIISYALFIGLCLKRLTKLSVETIEKNETKMLSNGYPAIGGACAVMISRIALAASGRADNHLAFVFLSVVLFLFAVLFLLATASVLKFIIIKKLKL